MTGFLLDTHVWLWYIDADARLPRRLRRIIDASPDDGWLSPVSIWELGLLEARGRVKLAAPLRRWVSYAFDSVPLHQAALTHEVALAASEIDPSIRDPADRFIAATALAYELPLLTVDEDLVRSEWLDTRSG